MGWTLGAYIFASFVIATLLEMIGIFLLWRATGEEQTIRSAWRHVTQTFDKRAERNSIASRVFVAASLAVLARAALVLTIVWFVWHLVNK